MRDLQYHVLCAPPEYKRPECRPNLKRVFTPNAFDLGDTELTQDLEAQLKIIADVKNFALQELKLNPTPHYLRYRETENARMLYSLYVTPKTRLPENDLEQVCGQYIEGLREYSSNRKIVRKFLKYGSSKKCNMNLLINLSLI